ncbi:MAG TPA: dienelactone hydrolase family protein [Chitinophagaceae bacterium]|nr:dienelactone hydrolase family protein [Chitinophagaceae bacterium]
MRIFIIAGMATTLLFGACKEKEEKSDPEKPGTEVKLREENVTYSLDTVTMHGFLVYDENQKGPRPGIVVVHEWWGLNDYPKMRARQLAEMGYVAFAADIYGNGKTVDNPADAQALATPFFQNPQMAKVRLDAAVEELKAYEQTDKSRIAGIGYCFGGGLLINSARLGEDMRGVVSFHGGLVGTPADRNLLKAEILVCHGEADPLVPPSHVAQFKKQMDSIGARYTFKSYPNALHAFTNPAATEVGKRFELPVAYDAAADSASWNDMKEFFQRILK